VSDLLAQGREEEMTALRVEQAVQCSMFNVQRELSWTLIIDHWTLNIEH
jgi:hypothetical protein